MEDCRSFIDLLGEAKKREKDLVDLIMDIYSNIKNNTPLTKKELLFSIKNLGEDYPKSDLAKYLHLHKLKYDD